MLAFNNISFFGFCIKYAAEHAVGADDRRRHLSKGEARVAAARRSTALLDGPAGDRRWPTTLLFSMVEK